MPSDRMNVAAVTLNKPAEQVTYEQEFVSTSGAVVQPCIVVKLLLMW